MLKLSVASLIAWFDARCTHMLGSDRTSPRRAFDPTVVAITAGTLVLVGCVEYEIKSTPEAADATPTDETVLDCTADQPPGILDTTPAAGDVLQAIDAIALDTWVTDAETPLEALSVVWSAAGQVVAEAAPDPSGYATGQWIGTRAPGDQTLTLQVMDSCGNEVLRDIPLCQQDGFSEADLFDESWSLNGSATLMDDGTVELTGLQMWQVGSAFVTDQTIQADQIEIVFEFKTDGGNGADGLAFTALDTERATTYLGGAGCGLGYGGNTWCDGLPVESPLPGWSIELDTWFNYDIDPTPLDHVAFTFDGQVATPEVYSPLPELEETGWHRVEMTIDAPHITVVVDGVTYIDEDIPGYYDFPAHIGFTGATGGETNFHRVRLISVSQLTCPE